MSNKGKITPNLYVRALRASLENGGRCSKIFFQRHLKIGFPTADSLVHAFEQAGLISPENSSQRRKLLVDEFGIDEIEADFQRLAEGVDQNGNENLPAPLIEVYKAPPVYRREIKWSRELEDEIIDRICNGEQLDQICQSPHICSKATFFRWLNGEQRYNVEDAKALKARYDAARVARADKIAADVIAIADDTSNDMIVTHLPGGVVTEAVNHEHIQRSRLKCDVRLKCLARLFPSQWGEKLIVESGDAIAAPRSTHEQLVEMGIDLSCLTKDARAALRNFLEVIENDKKNGWKPSF